MTSACSRSRDVSEDTVRARAGAASASVLMLLPALAGMALGQRLRNRMSARTFKLCFMVSLALLGAYQAGRGLLGL